MTTMDTPMSSTSDTSGAAPRKGFRIKPGRLVAHLALLFFVALWTFPTVGLLVSSVRDKDQLAVSGWWTSLTDSTIQTAERVGRAGEQVEEGGAYVTRGDLLNENSGQSVQSFGITNATLNENPAGST